MGKKKSKGSRVVTFRDSAGVVAQVDEYLKKYGERRFDPTDRTTFIIAAIREKLAHLVRSRRRRVKRAVENVYGIPLGEEMVVLTGLAPPAETLCNDQA